MCHSQTPPSRRGRGIQEVQAPRRGSHGTVAGGVKTAPQAGVTNPGDDQSLSFGTTNGMTVLQILFCCVHLFGRVSPSHPHYFEIPAFR
jgi:hypothetical protein